MDITIRESEIIKKKILHDFNRKIGSGAFEVFLALVAFSSEKTKIARISKKEIIKVTGFSEPKVSRILKELSNKDFIDIPYIGRRGKTQIYKLKVL